MIEARHLEHQLLQAKAIIGLQRRLIDLYEQSRGESSQPSAPHETIAQISQKQAQMIALYKDIIAASDKLHQHRHQQLADKLGDQEKQIKELKNALEQAQRSGKKQAHPFSKGSKKNKPKKPGRKPGQGTFNHQQKPENPPEKTFEEPLHQCPHCDNTDLINIKKHSNIQVDLPRIQPVITEFITYSADCPCCHKRVRSMHANQLSNANGAAAISLGPRTLAIAADMHKHLGASYEKIADHFTQIFDFNITRSGLYQAIGRLAQKAEPIYQQLIDSIRAAAVVHADETGWRIGVLSAWLWVFSNQETTVYTIRSGKGARGHKAVLEILGKEFKGVLISDCFLAYDAKALDDWIKQKCIAHLLRDLKEFHESAKIAVLAFAKEAISLFQDAIELKQAKDQFTDEDYKIKTIGMERRLDRVL